MFILSFPTLPLLDIAASDGPATPGAADLNANPIAAPSADLGWWDWFTGLFSPASEWFGIEWLGPTGVVILAVMLVVLCIVAWGLNLISLPGNWLGVALLALFAWLGPDSGRAAIGYTAVAVAFGFALLGEVVEFAAGAMGAQKAGASRRSTLFAMIGSMAGAVGGAIIGVPVPVIGPVLAAILFGGVGAMAGAMYGEWSDGRAWRDSWSIAHAAFWGRTFGTLGKFAAGLAIVLIAIGGVLVN
ncbi:hypothetical protein Poly51_19330 [Rubripirellula tenax]|uniref:DUF456 domain-containing protein n=1 Tax=Rubripirellula tenax TaxID=2528015 RepID=A0A5C6FEK2_9BACT|nr:DUF456 family protein [Rubripirellula tenax]TWU59147.1 hypothetical protein Poly51_19330 [Rubripirellula tenax]